MGTTQSLQAPTSPAPTEAASEASEQETDEKFKEEVRKSAQGFKNLVENNKVMIFSATYCSYCTVAKVIIISF